MIPFIGIKKRFSVSIYLFPVPIYRFSVPKTIENAIFKQRY